MMLRNVKDNQRKISILLADDHNLVAEAFSILLEETGQFTVTVVHDLMEAKVAIIANGAYDLALLDVRMPGMNGAKSIAEAVTLNAPGKVAMLTGGLAGIGATDIYMAQAAGIILKAQPIKETLRAIDLMLAGDRYFPMLDAMVAGKFAQQALMTASVH